MDAASAIRLLARRSVEWNAAREAAEASAAPTPGVSALDLPASAAAPAAALLGASGSLAERTPAAERPLTPPPGALLSVDAARAAVAHTVQFQRLQSDRVREFASFEAAFLALLETRDLLAYQTASLAATGRFAEISAEITALTASLEECGAASVAALAKGVQIHERQKLKLTAHLQLARQQIATAGGEPSAGQAASLLALQNELELERRAIRELLDEVMGELYELRDQGALDGKVAAATPAAAAATAADGAARVSDP